MTNRTPLSPAAQTVRDAVLATYADNIPKDDNLWALDRASVVAALRAAAEHLGESRAPGAEFEDLYGRIVDVDDLLTIAAELEGANG